MTIRISAFPITTTDLFANEVSAGVSPMLCADVGDVGSISTSAVCSEYGIRHAIVRELTGMIHGDSTVALSATDVAHTYKNTGYDESLSANTIYLKSIDSTNNRFTFRTDAGTIFVGYDGSSTNTDETSAIYVGGGKDQMWCTIPANSGIWGSFDHTTKRAAGYCSTTIPIYANWNLDETSVQALQYWNKDIAIAKMSVRIPLENAFVSGDQIIQVGIQNDPGKFGYFLTKTSTDISQNGEWQTFNYSDDMIAKQYSYFDALCAITFYTSGVTLYDGSNLVGAFDYRVWYDQVNYWNTTVEYVNLSAGEHTKAAPVLKTATGNGLAEVQYFSGEWMDWNGNLDNSYYTISGGNSPTGEYFMDRFDLARINILNGEKIALYIGVSGEGEYAPTGTLLLKYGFTEY